MPRLMSVLVAAVAAAAASGLNAAEQKAAIPDVHDQVTFLYYADLREPRRFYGEVLGLPHYYETLWVTLYRSSPGATIGIVQRTRDSMPADTKRDAVMVSIVTNDVNAWYQRLKRGGRVRFDKDIYDHPDVPIRAFLIREPAGCSVEFFQWRK
jgi:extradiol dioxygenase family protein